MSLKAKHNSSLYILITSLFYPAILGTIFYFLLEDFSLITLDKTKFIYVIASLGIIVSFSIDFLYTYTHKSFYSKILFIFDIIILFLLFLSYKSLIAGLKSSKDIHIFFLGYILIHIIFFIWDVFYIPSEKRSVRLIVYDLAGLILSIFGFCFFGKNPIGGVVYLWLSTFAYFFIGYKDIFPLINSENKS